MSRRNAEDGYERQPDGTWTKPPRAPRPSGPAPDGPEGLTGARVARAADVGPDGTVSLASVGVVLWVSWWEDGWRALVLWDRTRHEPADLVPVRDLRHAPTPEMPSDHSPTPGDVTGGSESGLMLHIVTMSPIALERPRATATAYSQRRKVKPEE